MRSDKSSQLKFTSSNSTIEALEKLRNMFKVTKKPPTKMTSFSSVSIVGCEQVNGQIPVQGLLEQR